MTEYPHREKGRRLQALSETTPETAPEPKQGNMLPHRAR